MRSILIAALALLFSTAGYAVAPGNPSLEDLPDLDQWTAVEDYGDIPGSVIVIRGSGDATDGDAYGHLSFQGATNYGGSAWGPALISPTFIAGAGEMIGLDYRVVAGGGFCGIGDPSTGDAGLGRAYLVHADTHIDVATFFDDYSCSYPVPFGYAEVVVPATDFYYIRLQVGSSDDTGGSVVGASLDVDNVVSSNLAPDCSGAFADPAMLWPPNHKFVDVAIMGVTDPEGDAFSITVDSIFQDEPTNGPDDGDTCPDASGLGTDTATVRAERVGGEEGYEGDGRVYWIEFTATDIFGASCTATVNVSVPHDKKIPAYGLGPNFDSTECP